MTESIVHEWLADYAALSPVEVHSFATSLEHDQQVTTAIYTVLEDRSKYQDLTDSVCDQLFSFYRSREVELQRFALQFLPTLMFIYLNSVAHGDKRSCRSVETLLIGLYNLEVVDENGQPKCVSFRLPSLAQSSIYHEPMSLAPASLTESALRRLEECNTKLVSWGPLPQVEVLNAQNRIKVLTALLFVYNRQLSLLHKSAFEQLCKVSSKLVTQGFSKQGHHQRSSYGSDSSFVPRLLPRIPVSSQLLLELMHATYFAMFNGYSYIATQALEDIHNRASYEGYPEVLLVTNAIRNSLHVNPSGQPSDGPMGISVALTPATTTVTTAVSKSMITNASFRTKKLPDDIPIQDPNDVSGDGKGLSSIVEEQEEGGEKLTPKGSSSKNASQSGKNIGKLSSLTNLGKKAKDSTKNTPSKNGGLERKESGSGELKKLLSSQGIKDGPKSLLSRGSIVSSAVNGESASTELDGSVIISKKRSLVENSNGPLPLDGTPVNGSLCSSSISDADKNSPKLDFSATMNNVGISAEARSSLSSCSSSVSERDMSNTPASGRKILEVDNIASVQVSTV